ncbi:hypothetical protein FB107DRAFT_275452 [Schizophyllum commune]
MGPLVLFILRLLVDILQTCALSNIPDVARYIMISIAAIVIVAFACYMLTPRSTMRYCDRAHDAATALLAEAMERGDGEVYAEIQVRLTTLSFRREEIARATWGPPAPGSSFPATFGGVLRACAALWLLYRYHGLSEDINDLARTIQHSRASDEGEAPRAEDETMSAEGETPSAAETPSAGDNAGSEAGTSATAKIDAAEEHEMHILGDE